jgi:basic membrane protein A
MNKKVVVAIAVAAIIIVAAVGAWWMLASETEPEEKIKMAAIYEGSVDQPYSLSMHQAMEKAEEELGIIYDYSEIELADIESTLRSYAEAGYDAIWPFSYAFADACKLVAVDYPEIAFLYGNGLTEAIEPNISVISIRRHETAYLAGRLAGHMTETNVTGVVVSFPFPAVNQVTNAFKLGAETINPDVVTKFIYIESWWDPLAAKEAGFTLVDSFDVDVIFCERYGAETAAEDRGVYAIGNIMDCYEEAPEAILTSTLKDVYPIIEDVYEGLEAGTWEPKAYVNNDPGVGLSEGWEDLAPYHGFDDVIPDEVKADIQDTKAKIISGEIVVPIIETEP